MKRFVIEIQNLVVDASVMAPMPAERFRRAVETALRQRIENGGAPPQVVAKQSVTMSVATANRAGADGPAALAGQVAQVVYQSLPRRA